MPGARGARAGTRARDGMTQPVKPGFFGKLLSFGRSEKTEAPLKFRIAVKVDGPNTTVSVLNASGAPDTSPNAQRIVQVIADDLK